MNKTIWSLSQKYNFIFVAAIMSPKIMCFKFYINDNWQVKDTSSF